MQENVKIDREVLQQKVGTVKADYDACMNQLELLHQAVTRYESNSEVMAQLQLLNNQMQQLGTDINAHWWQPEYPPNPPIGH